MPYSDNLYSMVDEDDSDVEPIIDYGGYLVGGEAQGRQVTQPSEAAGLAQGQGHEEDEDPAHVLSPVNSSLTSTEGETRTSSNNPRIPNVMVRDPTLEPGTTAESKAQEARQERLANEEAAQGDPTVDAPPRVTSPLRSSSARQPVSSASGRSISPAHYVPSTAAYHPFESRSASSSSYTSHTPRNIYTQRSSLLPTEAPPAYTPSPTTTDSSPSSPLTSSQGFSNNYQTFQSAIMGRPEETQRLLAGPQSMGGPAYDEGMQAMPTWKDRVRRRGFGRGCRVASIALLLVLVTAGLLGATITSLTHQAPRPQPDRPSDPPAKGIQPPSKGIQPPSMDYPAYDGDIPWFPNNAWCTGNPKHHIQLSERVIFSADKSFSFSQDVPHHDDDDNKPQYHPVQVRGDVILRRSERDTPGSSITLEYITNDDTLKLEVDWDDNLQAYRVTVPRKLPWDGSVSWPCVAIRATIWVPDDGVINELSVSSIQLNIALLDNLSIQVKKALVLAAVSGKISAATDGITQKDNLVKDSAPDSFKLDSRWIEAHSVSGGISGYWPLYDYLGISTTSGDIKVRIEPKEESEHHPSPAVLNIKTTSGTVDFREPVLKAATSSTQTATDQLIPPRDYRSNIQSTSGTIRGSLAFSSAARIHSISGTTEVELLPVLDLEDADSHRAAGYESNLETASTSGTMRLRVLEPLWIGSDGKYLPPLPPSSLDTKSTHLPAPPSPPSQPSPPSPPPNYGNRSPRPFRCLQSRHSATSSTLKIEYPASWEGDVDIGTLSGSVKVTGDGLRIIKAGKDWPPVKRGLLARKGEEGGSSANVRTTSGSVTFAVGERIWGERE